MTGYIRFYKPDMRFCEYDTYKAVYCSLCRTLGKEYSRVLRLTLSYDYTLLALLGIALSEKRMEFEQKRCVVNPLKKCNYCKGNIEVVSYAAAVSVVLLEFKIRDNIKDSGFLKSIACRICHPFVRRQMKKAYKKYPELKKAVDEYSTNQANAEADKNSGLDKASHPTALALGKIFSALSLNRLEQDTLYRFGYCLGKWVYLLDAADDFEDDLKRGNFNPFKSAAEIKETATPLLNSCEAECAEALDTLEIKKYKTILENIVFQGLMFEKKKVLEKEE